METEDTIEEEKRKQQEKLETLEAIVRMLELKSKNSADQSRNRFFFLFNFLFINFVISSSKSARGQRS